MANLCTKYMGLELKSPLIAGSSGLTNSVKSIVELEKCGIGAVVLKSLFEEQIRHEATSIVSHENVANQYPEAYDYVKNYTENQSLDNYLNLIRDAKKAVSIPIIASINCVSTHEWTGFASKIEAAGADALELNIFILPSDPYRSSEENEKVYFDIITDVRKRIKIPLSVKISYYFSSLAKTAVQLSWTGINGLVMFNRFFSPDIDLDEMEVTSSYVFSQPGELHMPLRWIAMLSDRVHCDLASSTGVENGDGALKMLLAGAKAVQITSALYKYGASHVTLINQQIAQWMDDKGYATIDEVIGKMSIKNTDNPASYERVQFMKHFSGIE
jgi:dihydroorotate dehydrogenase (fumarate)